MKLAVLLLSLLSFAPLLWQHQHVQALYWFHDDLDLLAEANGSSPGIWIFRPFAEASVPVFKTLWLGAVRLAGGSYFAMIALNWAVHALNIGLTGLLLIRLGASSWIVVVACLTLALPWTNIETLCWSVQLAPLLATMLLLVAWYASAGAKPRIWTACGAAFASGLCFSRGLITGFVLTCFLLSSRCGLRVALAPLVPSLIVASIAWHSGGATLAPHLPFFSSASFAAYHFLLNPLYWLLPVHHKSVDGRALLLFGLLKCVCIAAAFRIASPRLRAALLTLLLFDLINSALLGLARSETGLERAVSYRYQYISLLCLGPFLGVLSQRLWAAASVLRYATPVLCLGWALLLTIPWARHAPRWAAWRGTEVRRIVESGGSSERVWPSRLTVLEVRRLRDRYHLH